MSLVRIKGLEKTFSVREPWPWSPPRQVAALKHLDLEISAGEVLAVVGQSGSGKTTLSRVLLGLESPTAGEIWLEDERWDTASEVARQKKRARYQYVPQDAMAALDPQQTAFEHVVETLTVLSGRSRAEAAIEAHAMLERLGLGQREGALPREMSGGEQRRVTLARVLSLRPRLIVADEPTSGLDPERRAEVLRDLIGNLHEETACVLVTHDMEAAREWCSRAVVMLDGWIIEEFDPRGQEPVHPYGRTLFDPWNGPLPRGSLASDGCPFQPDCLLCTGSVAEKCRVMPALSPGPGHRVACHGLDSPAHREV